jgi:O-acetyl-ADP-ribose deacetylase (regulator of RNase III)
MELHVAQADITTMPVDAIVVPCTSMGTMTEPIRSAVLGKGGEAIEQELKAKAPLAVGAAMLAGAGDLTAKCTILVPIKKHVGDLVATENLRKAVKAALIAANIKRYQTLALPNMVQDEATVSRSDAARAVVQEIRTHTAPFPETIYLVDGAEEMVKIFTRAIENAPYSL